MTKTGDELVKLVELIKEAKEAQERAEKGWRLALKLMTVSAVGQAIALISQIIWIVAR